MQPLHGRIAWLTGQNENWDDLLAEHQRLYDVIASGDPERAKLAALEHVRVNREITLGLLFPR
jgi:DNA-binding FadR family transcriptional regulator